MVECQSGSMTIRDLDFEAVNNIIDFCYTGEITISQVPLGAKACGLPLRGQGLWVTPQGPRLVGNPSGAKACGLPPQGPKLVGYPSGAKACG